jgi:hypothetical protein
MVVTCLAPIAPTGVTHERIGSPSRCTVHAPQSATPQPYLVPVRPSVSRSIHSSGVSGLTSTACSARFTRICNAAIRQVLLARGARPAAGAESSFDAGACILLPWSMPRLSTTPGGRVASRAARA